MSGTCIAMVSCATDTETRDVSVERVLEDIRSGDKGLKGQITQIRNRFEMELATAKANAEAGQNVNPLQVAKLAVSELKKQLPAVIWSGTFSYRASDKLLQHSGLQCGDLDDLGPELPRVREQLQTSRHLYALFLSPTGHGLKPVFRVPSDASKHAGSFRAVEAHVKQLIGIQIDESGKDIGRLCFMSYDPELYHSPNATELEPLPEPEKPKPATFNTTVDLTGRERITAELLQCALEWCPEKNGYFVTCPGISLHTTGHNAKECIVYLNGPPTIECKHTSCRGVVEGVNHELRSRIGKAEFVQTPRVDLRGGASAQQGEADKGEDATIARLAALSLADYERVREAEADKLGFRKSILDILVNAKRVLMHPPRDGEALQGIAVKLTDVEPWPEPVNGAEILDQVATRFEHYVVMPEGAAHMLALWCTHTHVFKLFQKSPRLYISAPTEECGKSTLLNCCSLFCARAKRMDNMSTAVMFRLVAGHFPTILADECDKWLFTNGELVGLVQSGTEQGGTVMRCEGDSNDLREFGCYAPFALAAIGKLPSQLHSRSIVTRLGRATKEEIKKRSPFDLQHVEDETELTRKLARWILDNRERIASCNPKLPEQLFNRIADNWRPLFKIAEIAGGEWPRRCTQALVKLTTREDERENLRVMVLADIQQVFTGEWPPPGEGIPPLPVESVFTKDLLDKLAEMKERPWSEICKGKPITARWLASTLSAFGIRSHNIWDGEKQKQAKGYERAQFDDVFARYVPETAQTSAASVQPSNSEVKPKNLSVQGEIVWTDKKEPIHEAYGRLDGSPTGEGPRKGESDAETLVGTEAESVAASIPVMITKRMEAELQAMGYTEAVINKMTPGQAHRIIASSPGSKPVSGDLKL